jgi:hypothetical protein
MKIDSLIGALDKANERIKELEDEVRRLETWHKAFELQSLGEKEGE